MKKILLNSFPPKNTIHINDIRLSRNNIIGYEVDNNKYIMIQDVNNLRNNFILNSSLDLFSTKNSPTQHVINLTINQAYLFESLAEARDWLLNNQ